MQAAPLQLQSRSQSRAAVCSHDTEPMTGPVCEGGRASVRPPSNIPSRSFVQLPPSLEGLVDFHGNLLRPLTHAPNLAPIPLKECWISKSCLKQM